MTDIFISYSRRDKAFVRNLHDALKTANRESWVDWEDIPPTADWRAEIQAGIEASDAFAFVISPDSVESKVCGEEIDHALKLNKKLIPLLYREVSPETTHPSVSSHNWISFRETDDFTAAVQTLITALDTDLAATKLHTRLLIRAHEWQNRNRNPSFTLRGADLTEAEHWLARSTQLNPKPTPEQIEFIQASREATNARQRVTIASLGFGFVITVVLALLAFSQYTIAQDSLVQVQHKEATATNALGLAETNLREAWDTQSRFLADQSRQQLSAGNVRVALLLGLESLSHREDGIAHAANYNALFGALASPVLDIAEMQHEASVYVAQWSKDERRILAVSGDKTVRIWDAVTGQEIVRFGHPGLVDGASWSPDETRVLTWSLGVEDSSARVWDVATGKVLYVLTGAEEVGGFVDVAWSYDGSQIVGRGSDKTYIWDAATGKEIASFVAAGTNFVWSTDDKHLIGVKSDYTAIQTWDLTGKLVSEIPFSGETSFVYWTRDQKRLASWYEDVITVTDSATGEPITKMAHTDIVSGLAWTEDETKLVSWSTDSTVRLWDAATGKELAKISSDSVVRYAELSHDGTRIMIFSEDNFVRVWNIVTNKLELAFTQHALFGIKWNHDESRILSWGNDGTSRVWDTVTHRAQVQILHYGMYSADWYNNEAQLLTAGGDTIRLWDATTGKETLRLSQPGSGVGYPSPDGKYVLTAAQDNAIHVWDIANSKEIAKLQHGNYIMGTLWTKAGTHILSWSTDNTLRLWEVATGKEVFNIATPNTISYASLNHDNSRLLWGVSDSRDIHMLDMKTGEEIRKITVDSGLGFGQWTHDGTSIIINSDDGMVQLVDVATGNVVRRFVMPPGYVGVWLSHDQTRMVTVSADRILRIWDVNSGAELAKFPHNNDISQVQWSRDDSRLLFWSGSESSDGAVYVLDGKTGSQLLRLQHTNFIQGAHWSRDGSRIMSWEFGKDVYVWDTQTGDELAQITHHGLISFAVWNSDDTRVLSVDQNDQALISLVDSDKLLNVAQGQIVQGLDNVERKLFFLPTLTPVPGATATPTAVPTLIGVATQAATSQATDVK
jgi:WD40 repeat protein